MLVLDKITIENYKSQALYRLASVGGRPGLGMARSAQAKLIVSLCVACPYRSSPVAALN
jgi:hypothetical protein